MNVSTKIAEGWKLARIKDTAAPFTGNSIKDELKNNYTDSDDAIPYISTRDIDEKYQTINYDNGLYVKKFDKSFKRAPKNSTFLCIEGGSAGKKIAFNDREACFVNKLCCFHSETDENKFIYYYLMSPAFTETFRSYITGLIGGVSISSLRGFSIILPPLPEQQKIANFLDEKCSEINKLSEDIRKQIEILESYKKSVITRAITKGLNSNVEMKDSGIGWIGSIPKSWEVLRIKNLGSARNGLTYSPNDITDEDGGTLVLRSSNVQGGKIRLNDNVYVSCKIPNNLMVKKGDILICSRNGSRELIGKNAIIGEMKATYGAFMMVFRSVDPDYLYYVLNSEVFSYYLGTFFTSTINQLTGQNFNNMKIVFCPDKEERKKIVDYLNGKTAAINESIKLKQQQLDDLSIYKKSIIYEYVTGKKRVV